MTHVIPFIKDVSSISYGTRVVKLEDQNYGKHGSVIKINRSTKYIEVRYDDNTVEEAGFYDFGLVPQSKKAA
jgi:hypothetical protein